MTLTPFNFVFFLDSYSYLLVSFYNISQAILAIYLQTHLRTFSMSKNIEFSLNIEEEEQCKSTLLINRPAISLPERSKVSQVSDDLLEARSVVLN